MKINVSGLLRNVNSSMSVEGEVIVPFITYNGDDIHINSPIKVKAVVKNTGENLIVTGNIKTILTLKCSRCLESFNYEFESDFEEELSNKDDSEHVVHFDGDIVDLTDIVVNNILLYLPMKAVCREDCKGLCPHCGTNLNIKKCDCTGGSPDPRLAVLKKLLKDN